MFEFVIGAFLGYLLGKPLASSSSLLRKPDKILSWNADIMGYRPVPGCTLTSAGETYLLCYEIHVNDQTGNTGKVEK